MTPGISSIGQIGLPVLDLPRAIAFYRDVLGLRFLFEANKMAFFDCGGLRLMLNGFETSTPTHGSIVYYKTADIQAAAASITEHGIALEAAPHFVAKMPDHDLWMAFLRDSEGNLVGLMSEVRH